MRRNAWRLSLVEFPHSNDSILIPTPVFSEVLVKLSTEQMANLLAVLNASAWFRVEAFDTIAAVELAVRTAKAIASGDKKEGSLGLGKAQV